VNDGQLNLDLSTSADLDPILGGLELERLGAQRAGVWAQESMPSPEDKVQFAKLQTLLGELAWAAGDELGALEAFTRAEESAGMNRAQSGRLLELREQILPRIVDMASAEQLAAHHAHGWERIARAAEAASDPESDPVAAGYFRALCLQADGELDGAIEIFESLVFEGCPDPGPYIGMALCLEQAELPEEAAGILDLALENGLAPKGALLQTWISMQLGGLGRDPWELVDQLAEMQVPERLQQVPTSEEYGMPWRFTYVEPTSTTWSRPSFGIEHWQRGLGPIGSGRPEAGYPRALWNRIMLFARSSFELPAPNLLYPFLRVYGRGSNDIYLNGTRVARHLIATEGYTMLPLRAPSVSGSSTDASSTGLLKGTNLLGMFGFNTRGPGMLDVGIEQDLGTLFWIRERLRQDGALRFNCGGPDWTTTDGRVFYADRFFSWGITGGVDDAFLDADILNTEDDELYRSSRRFYDDSVSAWYEIPLPSGPYQVTLHFAELNPAKRELGARQFDVTIEEERVLSALDVAGQAGFMGAMQASFDVQVADGWLDLKFTDKENFSFVNAIEILAR